MFWANFGRILKKLYRNMCKKPTDGNKMAYFCIVIVIYFTWKYWTFWKFPSQAT